MPVLSHKRARLRLGTRTPGDPSQVLIDEITGKPVAMWNRNALRLEFAIDEPGVEPPTLVSSFVGWNQIVAEIWASQLDGTLLAPGKALTAAGLTSGLTEAAWASGTGQHGAFTWSSAELAFAFAQKYRTAWISIVATDFSGNHTTCGAGEIQIVQDRALGGGVPPTPPELYLTAAEIYALLGGGGGGGGGGSGTGGISVVSGNGVFTQDGITYTWPVAANGSGTGLSLNILNSNAVLTTGGLLFTWPVAEIAAVPGAPLVQVVASNLIITLGGRSFTHPVAPIP